MGYVGTDGLYHKGQPKFKDMTLESNRVWKQSDHDRQRQDHKRDLIRPYLANGDANPEFIEQYREESIHTYKFIKDDETKAKER